MTPESRAELQQIGEALDERPPVGVRNHGALSLIDAAPSTSVQETRHVKRQRQGRQGQRQGQGQAPAAPGPRIGSLRDAYEGQLGEIKEAYPTLQKFPDDHGMWLLVKSSVLEGLDRKATFLVALPFVPGAGPVAWGFWSTDDDHRWIGPRHTNFFEGSICAFAASDRAWTEGGNLRDLLDLYSSWAFRHLHLEVIGRWPGKQYALIGHEPYYRRVEFKDDEFCSCPSGLRYAECCKGSDMQYDIFRLKAAFEAQFHRSIMDRRPPQSLLDFIDGQGPLPAIADVHPQFRRALREASMAGGTVSYR